MGAWLGDEGFTIIDEELEEKAEIIKEERISEEEFRTQYRGQLIVKEKHKCLLPPLEDFSHREGLIFRCNDCKKKYVMVRDGRCWLQYWPRHKRELFATIGLLIFAPLTLFIMLAFGTDTNWYSGFFAAMLAFFAYIAACVIGWLIDRYERPRSSYPSY